MVTAAQMFIVGGSEIDLGVGVYRDDTGRTPVFAAVKEAAEWKYDVVSIGYPGRVGILPEITVIELT